jgi:hypothetical protein
VITVTNPTEDVSLADDAKWYPSGAEPREVAPMTILRRSASATSTVIATRRLGAC